MPFDFEAAVVAPFRMQPGLRRLAHGATQLTPLAPGGKHQREKLAVLSAFWPQALCVRPGFDAAPALAQVYAQAAAEHPQAWGWDGRIAHARQLHTAVDDQGRVEQTDRAAFGLGDEAARCLLGLPVSWRQAALAALAFAEDLAILDARNGTLPWLAVCLPSHWAPETKVGRHFAEVHAPVADNALLLKASESLLRLVTGPERWERFVWTVTDEPRLHAHPQRAAGMRWPGGDVRPAWWRTEHQTFIPLPALRQAVFTIHVEVQPLHEAVAPPGRAAVLRDTVATMSPAVLAYRGLAPVREALLDWLDARAVGAPAP